MGHGITTVGYVYVHVGHEWVEVRNDPLQGVASGAHACQLYPRNT